MFIQAGDKLINTDELLYITKAKTKQVYIAVFKAQSTSVSVGQSGAQQQYNNLAMYLFPEEYKAFCKNLKKAQSKMKKEETT